MHVVAGGRKPRTGQDGQQSPCLVCCNSGGQSSTGQEGLVHSEVPLAQPQSVQRSGR